MLLQTPFHAYYAARMLDSLSAREQFLPVYASSDIQVYPFRIAAASFALRSPCQKGVILCDEAGRGKSHEAMLVINQRWLEGQTRILLCIPNADLAHQWVDMLERYYSIPYSHKRSSRGPKQNNENRMIQRNRRCSHGFNRVCENSPKRGL